MGCFIFFWPLAHIKLFIIFLVLLSLVHKKVKNTAESCLAVIPLMWTPHHYGHFSPCLFSFPYTILFVSLLWIPRYCGHFLPGPQLYTLGRFNCITKFRVKHCVLDASTAMTLILIPCNQSVTISHSSRCEPEAQNETSYCNTMHL